MTVDFALIAEAARVLRPAIVETPLLGSPVLDAQVGARVLCKADNLQRTGSFKYRGAFFRLSKLTQAERARGVVAFSSGNFAQALAAAGKAAGVAVTIVMPVDAPRAKIDATRGYGAEVVLSEHGERNREESSGPGRHAEARTEEHANMTPESGEGGRMLRRNPRHSTRPVREFLSSLLPCAAPRSPSPWPCCSPRPSPAAAARRRS